VKEGLTLPEIALRWMTHHSELKKELSDAIVSTLLPALRTSSANRILLLRVSQLIGASSTKHIGQNLLDLEKGPLPPSIVEAYVPAVALMIVHRAESTLTDASPLRASLDKAYELVKDQAPAYHH
jgi:hypothetical protein